MKIIWKDNFAREAVADALIAEGIKYEPYAKCMCEALRAKFSSEHSDAWFEVVPDDYRLCRGMEDLV